MRSIVLEIGDGAPAQLDATLHARSRAAAGPAAAAAARSAARRPWPVISASPAFAAASSRSSSALIAIVQIATMVAVLVATRRNVAQQQREALSIGGRVVEELLEAREVQLLDRVEILTADFAFREAVATGDRGTIDSVLENHGERVGASLVALLGLDGRVVAGAAPVVGALVAGQPAPEPFREPAAPRRGGRLGRRGGALRGPSVSARARARSRRRCASPGSAWASRSTTRWRASSSGSPRSTSRSGARRRTREPELFASTLGSERASPAGRQPRRARARHRRPARALPARRDRAADARAAARATRPSRACASCCRARWPRRWRPGARCARSSSGSPPPRSPLSVALAFALGRRVTQPVHTLVAGAQRILGGRYDTAVAVTSRDELGLLARTFNEMQHAIAERERRIVHQRPPRRADRAAEPRRRARAHRRGAGRAGARHAARAGAAGARAARA